MKQILIVEDEIAISTLMVELLKPLGFKTSTAACLKDARRIMKTFNPEIVFLDLRLPDGYGYELIPQLKDKHEDVKIVVVTAFDELENATEQVKSQVDHYIDKPFNKKAIFESLSDINAI